MSHSKVKTSNLGSAAIVCGHVAAGRLPILLAERSAPEDPADSGWQFLCAVEREDWNEAKVWSLQEIIDTDPSLATLIDLPIGTRLSRATSTADWENIPNKFKRN
jgi:hypothetical protein